MNKADSDRLESALIQLGLTPVSKHREADVVVLNSCVVRQAAEDKVTGMLGSLKSLKQGDSDRIIALMGCMVGAQDGRPSGQVPPRGRLHAPPGLPGLSWNCWETAWA